METSKYTIEPVSDLAEWDRLVISSPQGTLFSRSCYLGACGRDFSLYRIMKGGEEKAGLSFIRTSGSSGTELDDLVIYNGIIFCRRDEMKETKRRHEQFEITEFIIKWMDSNLSSIELALSPHFEDMRPFLWHNYHSKNPSNKFVLDLRYTSYLNISEMTADSPEENTALFRNLETLRQRNIREAREKKACVEQSNSADLLLNYYTLLMKSQNEEQQPEKIQRMKNLVETLLKKNAAVIYTAYNMDRKPIYALVYCIDEKRAYYLFGAGNPEADERFKGTLAFWDSFRLLAKEHNIREVDLEGINSPQRGWFKLSLGGDIRSYYQVYKRTTNI